MNRLIKLTEDVYIIVDDSKIKEGDYFFRETEHGIIHYCDKLMFRMGCFGEKITHSTRPELMGAEWMQGVKPICLQEVEELIYGYSVEKLIRAYTGNEMDKDDKRLYSILHTVIRQYKELVKDKKFSVEDMMDAMGFAAAMDNRRPVTHLKAEAEEYIRTKKEPKIEWDVEFDENGKLELV